MIFEIRRAELGEELGNGNRKKNRIEIIIFAETKERYYDHNIETKTETFVSQEDSS